MTVHVLPKWIKNAYDCPEIDATANHGQYMYLSPFVLGPTDTYVAGMWSRNFENLWQFSKVYAEHLQEGLILPEWYQWRNAGWADRRANRYPMGKGRKPEFSFWDGERLGYIDARKKIYARLYAESVQMTESFKCLEASYQAKGEITLKDYDAYDHIEMGMSLVDVINNPDKKMGHAFVLAMMLEGKLEECLET